MGRPPAPENILEGLTEELAYRVLAGAPHTIYQELWHIAFWQRISLDWASGVETPYPASPDAGFATRGEAVDEPWGALLVRYRGLMAETEALAGT